MKSTNERLNDFCYVILSFGRAGNVETYNFLKKKCGVKKEIFFVCSDDDPELKKYVKRFGEKKVFVFNKKQAVKDCRIDAMDNFEKYGVVLYARHYAQKAIREKTSYKNFVMLDDDYSQMIYRMPDFSIISVKKRMDDVCAACFEFYNKIPILKGFSTSQFGDFPKTTLKEHRFAFKCMNWFFCDVDKPLNFKGTFNEDVNFYVGEGAKNSLCFQINTLCIGQKQTQKNKGGMTGSYLDCGTYVKSFYSVMENPSAVKIYLFKIRNSRLHHQVSYNLSMPRIIREEWKKA